MESDWVGTRPGRVSAAIAAQCRATRALHARWKLADVGRCRSVLCPRRQQESLARRRDATWCASSSAGLYRGACRFPELLDRRIAGECRPSGGNEMKSFLLIVI